jgi:hypothetical protein
MLATPSLEQLRQDVRSRICRNCPLRPGEAGESSRIISRTPRRCEAQCPLFEELPSLARRAELVDPMICSREQVLSHLLHGRATHGRSSEKWLFKHFGDEVARLISERYPH